MKKKDLLMARVMSNLKVDKEAPNDKYYDMLTDGATNKSNDILMNQLQLSNILFKFEEIEIPSLIKYVKDNIINAEIIKMDDIMYAAGSFEGLLSFFDWGSPMYEILNKISIKLDSFYKKDKETRILKISKDELSGELLKFSRLVNVVEKSLPEIGLVKETLKCLKLYNPFADVTALITVENLPEEYKNYDSNILERMKNIIYRGQTDNNTRVMRLKSFDEVLGDAE